ncbi:GIY-YIG nuclease family protein [Candidatus Lokiarchaeum ossiferum]|uniref:GIY-YIG nuclease family protein n=1 Tax=Candidatus Lokiarchaeum ossiferum TaxID=2951803 RepID=UPI00352F9797
MGVYYVYILKCTSRKTNKVSLYTGSTQDLMIRIEQHRTGKGAKYTRGKIIDLAYFEMQLSRSEVMKREYEIKSFSSAKKWELIEKFQNNLKEKIE